MLVAADCDRFVLFNNRDQNLTLGMGRRKDDCQSAQDVEEGEISDLALLEEVKTKDPSEQQLQGDDSKASVGESISNEVKSEKPKVWTMQDLFKYQISRTYSSGLYNLAWAQAVQNKPLEEVLVMEYNKPNNDDVSNLKRSSSSSSIGGRNDRASDNASSKEEDDKVVIDITGDESEREEGELEEGEIDLNVNNSEYDVKGYVLEHRIDIIREALESVTAIYAEKSYDVVCSRIKNSLDSLWEMVLKNSANPTTDALVQLSFSVIQTLNSVFCSMNQNKKEQNKYNLSRLLYHVASQNPPLFGSEQMNEIKLMITSAESGTPLPSLLDTNKQNSAQSTEKVNLKAGASYGNDCSDLDDSQNEANTSNALKLETSSVRGRGILLPLLDLHKDHNEDSLPSPTRDAPSILPGGNAMTIVGSGVVKPEWPAPLSVSGAEDVVMPYYETDVLKAVSTYQQKFIRTSFHMSDRLPSPTPSEDYDNRNADTSGEEVSSSFSAVRAGVKSVNAPNSPESTVSSLCGMDICNSQGGTNVRNIVPVKSLSKSRDPRLRLKVDSIRDTTGSKKQKLTEEPVLDGPMSKRQRNGPTDFGVLKDVLTVTGTGGWLADRGSVRQVVNNNGVNPLKLTNAVNSSGTGNITPNIMSNGFEHLPVAGTNITVSLESLIKDIAVNPALWMNTIKMEQQKSIDPVRNSTHMLSSNSELGSTYPVNVALPKSLEVGQKSAGVVQTPQADSTVKEELEKIRMKPRDPRRVLHSNTVHKVGSSGPNPIKTSAPSSLSRSQEIRVGLNSQKQESQPDRKPVPLKNMTPTDITGQFTKNLKNIADIVSVSQPPMAPTVNLQVCSSQASQLHSNKADIKDLSEPENNQSGIISLSEEVAGGPSCSQNAWGDVEHIFEGLDDKQKAAFHKERARRIEEQKKMFAARKLCLVLDLDHTLLNSAKFAEVDPVHEEILRKKEEQDREKPHRHLFRFPHMGMWTKLRPGVWNFLEKASKLFELHLYTMGNKLYATEMAKLLDPKGTLFAGRVISRGNDGDILDGDERVPKSKDLEGVLGMESGVVIIDDSVRVWPHNKLNLIVVERYMYFPCSRRQFGLLGPSLLEIDHDERPEAGTLASSLAVIERIHQNFFAHRSLDDADVRNILALEQRKILGGCRIVFSRVFPVGEANPHLHPLWQTAEQFGAVCTNQIDEQVTHVVANSLGTDKVNWALSTGRFVVHPGWVEASALLYRRANEQDFAIKP